MIAALKNWQEVLMANGYSDSVRLLEIATLDLQMKLHSISEVELEQFCDAVRKTLPTAAKPKFPIADLGPHFNGAEKVAVNQNVVIMRDVRAASPTKRKRT